MTVFMGEAGIIELTRASDNQVLRGVIAQGDVNTATDTFSFDFEATSLISGDLVLIKATDDSSLDFVLNYGYTDGKWHVHIDEAGGIRLYTSFDAATAGEVDGRVALGAPTRDVPITLTVENRVGRVLGQVTSFELNTEREAVDVTEVGEEFRRRWSTLMSGSGQITCFFDYRTSICDAGYGTDLSNVELGVYMHQLAIRQQLGSEFDAKLYLVRRGAVPGNNDELWYDVHGVVTNVGVSFSPGAPVVSTIQFVTTGPVRLRVSTLAAQYLLQEDDGLILLERNQPAGSLAAEQRS